LAPIIGVSRQRSLQVRDRPDFPADVYSSLGTVWERTDLTNYAASRKSRADGRLRKTAS
jgi:hypothetical protein